MKNIHIIPTDKPSRLACDFDKLILNSRLLSPILYKTQNIYITSDEEIEEGDWFITKGEVFKCTLVNEFIWRNNFDKFPSMKIDCKKIILTTDQDLIKDGVQAINDDFLEWFVKNPSCEEVEVEEFEPIYGHQNNSSNVLYKIIIPKEEPNIIDQWLEKNGNPEITKQVDEEAKKLQKQHLIDMMKQDEELGLYDEPLRKQFPANVEGSKEFNEMCKEEQTKCYCGHTITCDCGPEQETNLDKHLNSLTECPGPRRSAIVSKQEILLEDVFNEEKKKNVKELINKHKQERSYSEEELKSYGEFCVSTFLGIESVTLSDVYLEQFKKK